MIQSGALERNQSREEGVARVFYLARVTRVLPERLLFVMKYKSPKSTVQVVIACVAGVQWGGRGKLNSSAKYEGSEARSLGLTKYNNFQVPFTSHQQVKRKKYINSVIEKRKRFPVVGYLSSSSRKELAY